MPAHPQPQGVLSRGAGGDAHGPQAGSKLTVMIVDDDPVNQLVMHNLLTPEGYEVCVCICGKGPEGYEVCVCV